MLTCLSSRPANDITTNVTVANADAAIIDVGRLVSADEDNYEATRSSGGESRSVLKTSFHEKKSSTQTTKLLSTQITTTQTTTT